MGSLSCVVYMHIVVRMAFEFVLMFVMSVLVYC